MSMYKTLCIAVVLLAGFAFTFGSRSADASPTRPIGPAIVAHGKLPNQTAPIPTTTIFTPTQTGLYRMSVYATIVKADPDSGSSWGYGYYWTDDAGTETTGGILAGYGSSLGQFYYENFFSNVGGPSSVFEAKAGTPITYNVYQQGPSDNSVYSLYYT